MVIALFDDLTRHGIKDKEFFLFEQKFNEILCSFLQNESSLFSRLEWRKLISLESNVRLLDILLRQNKAANDYNVNVLKVIFLSLDFHIFDEENHAQSQIEHDRTLRQKLYKLIGFFYVFQAQNVSMFVSEDEDDASPRLLISDEMKEYFVKLLRDDFFNKFDILPAKERKLILQTLLVLDAEGNDFLYESILDPNEFNFYKGTVSALLTHIVDDKEMNNLKDTMENGLFVSSAFVGRDENVFQRKHLNEWRFARIKEHKMIRMEQWTEDGNTKGPLFEWRKGGSREGAGIHPTLNDVDTDKPNQVEPMNQIVDAMDVYEDYAMLLPNDEVDCKKIIMRSACDLLLEHKQDSNGQCIAIFLDESSNRIRQQFNQHLCDLLGAKCVSIDKNDLKLLLKN